MNVMTTAPEIRKCFVLAHLLLSISVANAILPLEDSQSPEQRPSFQAQKLCSGKHSSAASPSQNVEREMQTACSAILELYVRRVEITPSTLRLETDTSDQAPSLTHLAINHML